MLLEAGDRQGAIKQYRERLDLSRRLAAKSHGDLGWQLDMATFLKRLGETLLAAGDRQEALTHFRERLGIMRGLAAKNPGDVQWQTGLVLALFGTASALWQGQGRGLEEDGGNHARPGLGDHRAARHGRPPRQDRQGWKEELVTMLKDTPEGDGPLVFAETSRGDALRGKGKYAEAAKHYAAAAERIRQYSAEIPVLKRAVPIWLAQQCMFRIRREKWPTRSAWDARPRRWFPTIRPASQGPLWPTPCY